MKISTNTEIEELLQKGTPVFMGVSGGKDSSALGIALTRYLDSIGHPRENRALIHSDLGGIEWADSLPWCEKLSEFIDTPLTTVRRAAGGMIERWETRWSNNWNRYLNLESLKVILPWSTPSMRFCTSELKTAIICREIRKQVPTGPVISAIGIRSEESPNRAKAPFWKEQNKLIRKGSPGFDWSPIKDWTLSEIKGIHEQSGFPLHPAYTQFGSSRVSCSFCILATAHDQTAALKDPRNHESYKLLCELELKSAFSFQSNKWLCDLLPDVRAALLPGSGPRLERAKELARERAELEKTLPASALFLPGKPWPPKKISRNDAEKIAFVRNKILGLYGIQAKEDPEDIQKTINAKVDAHTTEAPESPEEIVKEAIEYQLSLFS